MLNAYLISRRGNRGRRSTIIRNKHIWTISFLYDWRIFSRHVSTFSRSTSFLDTFFILMLTRHVNQIRSNFKQIKYAFLTKKNKVYQVIGKHQLSFVAIQKVFTCNFLQKVFFFVVFVKVALFNPNRGVVKDTICDFFAHVRKIITLL